MARIRKPGGGGGGSSSGAAGGVLSGTYPDPGFAVDMATQAELNAALAAPAWNAIPALQNSWVASGTQVPRYTKDILGYVQAEGEIQAGTVTINTLVFTFPVGFRPTKRYTFLAAGASAAAIRGFAVGSDGTVILNYAATGSETLSLSMIRFPIF